MASSDMDVYLVVFDEKAVALSSCSKTDVIVQYFIEWEAYSIHEVNAALFEHGEAVLTGPQEIK